MSEIFGENNNLGSGIQLSFATAPWSNISQLAKAGKASSVFKVGDMRVITIDDKPYVFGIMGFDTYDVVNPTTYGRQKNGITIGMIDCLDTDHEMESSGTNSGGWGKPCEMKTWLNGLSIESELSNVITYSRLPYCATYNSSAMSYDTTSKLFLPSEYEVFGKKTHAPANEGSQFAYYTNGILRVKRGYWWLRSVSSGYDGGFCVVDRIDSVSYDRSGRDNGVAPCFCV